VDEAVRDTFDEDVDASLAKIRASGGPPIYFLGQSPG
jgi:hypothetical protein